MAAGLFGGKAEFGSPAVERRRPRQPHAAGGRCDGKQGAPAAERHGHIGDPHFVQQPGVGKLGCDMTAAHHPDVPVAGVGHCGCADIPDVTGGETYTGVRRRLQISAGQHLAGQGAVGPGTGVLGADEVVRYRTHHQCADPGQKLVIVRLERLEAEVQQPVELVVFGGYVAIQ